MTEALRKLGRGLGSLKLTVVLLGMSIFLIFAGTWAQIDMGIWSTLKTYFRSFYVFIPFAIFTPRHWQLPGGIPYPGGYLIGGLMMINLIVAHATRFRLSRRYTGIWLIHSGLILLLVGELVTALFANEANMTIDEGQTVNYTEDSRAVELAIIGPADGDEDQVVVVPERLLAPEGLIRHPLLPFDLRVDHYFPNAEIFGAGETRPAAAVTAASGTAARRGLAAVERPVTSGVASRGIDLPVAVVTLLDGDRELGTYMTALYFTLSRDLGTPMDEPQEVTQAGKTYDLVLRYKRIYKPYSLNLVDFRHDRYLGTDTPKNFSSQVRLIDPSRNEDREVLIYMNHPLRYRGETFYQASFKRGDTSTILQVVRNPGWLLPYLACTLGGLGMVIHFSMHLVRFLRRRQAA